MDTKALYGQPVDFAALYAANELEDNTELARTNATISTILGGINNKTLAKESVFLSEVEKLKSLTAERQDEYLKSVTSSKMIETLQADIAKISSYEGVGRATPQGVISNPSVGSQAAIEWLRAQAEATKNVTMADLQEGWAARSEPFRGAEVSIAAIQAYRNAPSAEVRGIIEQQFYGMLLASTLQKRGFKPEELLPWKEGGLKSLPYWALEFVPGKYLSEWWNYDSGVFDMAKFKKLAPEERMRVAARVADELDASGASPLTIVSVLDRMGPDGSIPLEGLFGGLDLLALVTLPKAIAKTARAVNSYRILRKYENAVGVAAEVGDTDLAARLTALVMSNPSSDVAGVVGIDKIVGGMNASPFPYSALDASVVDGIADKTLKYIEDQRKIQNHYLNQAMNPDTLIGSGFVRPPERVAAEAEVMSRLPAEAEVTARTPWGFQVRVVTNNVDRFKSEEELISAEKKYEVYREAYEQATDELDRFYQEAAGAKFEPSTEWVNRLEAQKARAKQEMDDAYAVLTKGIEPDKIDERFVWYTRDNMGIVNGVIEGDPITRKLLSPTTYIGRIDNMIVPERTELIAKQEQLFTLFEKNMSEVMKTLGRSEFENVANLLSHGDDQGVVFRAAQLEQGIDIPGIGTVRLDKKGMAAYYKARDLLDAAHGVRSMMKFRRLGYEGYRQTVFSLNGVSRKFFVKDASTSTTKDGKTFVRLPPADEILDARPNTGAIPLKIRGEEVKGKLRESIQSGKSWIVQFEQPVRVGDKMYNYGVVPAKKIGQLTPDVLPYRTGYVPRIYENVPYVVRAQKNYMMDGRDSKTIWETERFFDSRKEAERWVAMQQDGVKYKVDSDWNWREQDPTYQKDVNEAIFSGLYEDYRGNKIPFGSTGGEAPRVGAFTAMDRYLKNLSWSYPLNDWRQGVMDRYFKSVNEYLVDKNSLNSEIMAGAPLTQEQRQGIIALRDYLKEQLSLTDPGERLFQNTSKWLGERMEDSWFWNQIGKTDWGKKVSDEVRMKFLYGADNAKGYGLLRNLAFRTYLGFMNMSQLLVQASNMAVVFSLHPLNFPSVARRQLALRMVAFASPADEGYESAVRIAAKAALMKYEDFEPMVRALHRSGWAYTARSSADAAMAIRKLSPGGSLNQTKRVLDKMMLLPFTEGELQARLYAFIDTYTRMQRKLGRKVDLTQPDKINDIIREATRVAFNYTQANRAEWQKGALSIPTQFLQVPAKFYEEVFLPIFGGKHAQSQFTRAERLRIALGQVLMFGTLGIPAGVAFKDGIAKWLTTEGDNGALYPELNDDQLEILTGGLVDWGMSEIVKAVTGDDVSVAVADRIALANGFNMFISNFTGSDPDAIRALTGAAGGVVAQRMWPAIDMVARVHGTQIAAGTFGPNEALEAIDKLAAITTTWNNYHRARLWEQFNMTLSREGTEIIPLDPDTDQALIALKKLGISSYDEYAAFRVKDWNQKNNPAKEVRDAMKTYNLLLLEYSKEGWMTVEGQRRFSVAINMVRQSLSSEVTRIEFDDAVKQSIMDMDSMASKEYMKTLSTLLYGSEGLPPPPAELNILEDRVNMERGY